MIYNSVEKVFITSKKNMDVFSIFIDYFTNNIHRSDFFTIDFLTEHCITV